jgi:hypothetical protein
MPTPNSDDITKALLTKVKTLADAGSWAVEWPNKVLNTAELVDTPWFRPTILPGIPEAAAIGDDAPDRHMGVLQISGFFPKDKGDGAARAWASTVLAAFPRGGTAVNGTAALRFEKSYTVPAIIEDKYYHLPVRVEYRTDL